MHESTWTLQVCSYRDLNWRHSAFGPETRSAADKVTMGFCNASLILSTSQKSSSQKARFKKASVFHIHLGHDDTSKVIDSDRMVQASQFGIALLGVATWTKQQKKAQNVSKFVSRYLDGSDLCLLLQSPFAAERLNFPQVSEDWHRFLEFPSAY